MKIIKREKNSLDIVPLIVLFAVAIFAVNSFAASPQDYTEGLKVKYQLTDVKVKDQQGNYVKGLSRADFNLLVDGKPYDIKSCDEFLSASPDSPNVREYIDKLNSLKSGEAAPAPPVAPRFFIIILDRGNLGHRAFIESKKFARRFVNETMLPFDRAAVFMLNGTLKVLTGPNTDKQRTLRAIENASAMRANDLYNLHQFEINPLYTTSGDIRPDGEDGPGYKSTPNAIVNSRRMESELLTRNYFDIFKMIAKVFKNMPEKKSVLFFSEGFARSSTFIKMHADYLASLNFFNSGNTSFYVIKRGPRIPEWASSADIEQARISKGNSMPSFAYQILRERDDMLREVAHNTNGSFFDQSIPSDNVLKTLEHDLGNYYMLGFIPPKTNDKTHRLKLSVKGHPEYQVVHRQKFITAKSFNRLSGKEKMIHLEEGFLTPGFHQQLKMKVFTDNYSQKGKPRMTLAFELPSDGLNEVKKGEHELEMVLNIEDAKGNIRHRIHKTFNSEGRVENGELHLMEDFPVPNEPYAVYLAVRDNSNGNRSTWYKTIYPKAKHLKQIRARSPFSKVSADIGTWKSKKVKDGVKVKNN
jgi:VWFA-related protein